MTFPLNNYKYQIPGPNNRGGFGFKRKYDTHTGVDLYCEDGAEVYAIESGEVCDIVKFTGFDESPWWEDTWAVVIKGKNGYILYGEIQLHPGLYPGLKIPEGLLIGNVKRVLKKDKGINPTSMLHMELYSSYAEPVWWKTEQKPSGLEDITYLLKSII